ncbi:uncharacterized protein M6D78_001239 [Vipera latastei]
MPAVNPPATMQAQMFFHKNTEQRQTEELADKDATIRALEEENSSLASELSHLVRQNEELEHKLNLDPERDADREELLVAVLKNQRERYQKAISRLTTEVQRERERYRELMRAREQAIDAVCSHLLSIPYSQRRLSPLQEANRR